MATLHIPFLPSSHPQWTPSPHAHRLSDTHSFPSPPPPSVFSQPSYSHHHQQQQQHAPNSNPNTPTRGVIGKRRHEDEGDEMQEREREEGLRRVAGSKRAKRVVEDVKPMSGGSDAQDTPAKPEEDEVDVGILLASLPETSLLPILSSLLTTHPSLKPTVITLIPRPSLSTVLAAITASARKVHSAYPLGSSASTPTFGGLGYGAPPAPVVSGGFGFGAFGAGGGSGGFGVPFGAAFHLQQHHQLGAQPNQPGAPPRDAYARSRLRAPLAEHISITLSYLPYFTRPAVSLPSTSHPSSNPGASHPAPAKQPPHPSETFTYIHTSSLLALQLLPLFPPPTPPPSSLLELLSRLHSELSQWSRAVDEHLNQKGGMFGEEMLRGWSRGLDELASVGEASFSQSQVGFNEQAGQQAGGHGQEWAQLRDQWVLRCGWLIGRWPNQGMEL